MQDYNLDDRTSVDNATSDLDNDRVWIKEFTWGGVTHTPDWTAIGSGFYLVDLQIGQLKVWKYPRETLPVFTHATVEGHPAAGVDLILPQIPCIFTDGTSDSAGAIEVTLYGTTAPPIPNVVNTRLPVITGTPGIGNVFTQGDNGDWTGTPPFTFSRKWERDLADITPAQTATTYTTQAGDNLHSITAFVTCTDANGKVASARSNPIAINVAFANVTPGVLSGAGVQGSNVFVSAGTYAPTAPDSVVYHLYVDGVDQGPQTFPMTNLSAIYVGHTLTVEEWATKGATTIKTFCTGSLAVVAPGVITADTQRARILNEFASHPDKAWQGFTDFAGANYITADTPDQIKAAYEAHATNSPTTQKLVIEANWDGLLAGNGQWDGPPGAKLTTQTGAFYGYQIPAGGVMIAAKAGRTPKFDSRLIIDGPAKLHLKGIGFAGKLGGLLADRTFCLKMQRSSVHPLLGCVYLEDCIIGQSLNRAGTPPVADYASALGGVEGYSFRSKGLKVAGVYYGLQQRYQYVCNEYLDLQDYISDLIYVRGYSSAYAGRDVFIYGNYILRRNPCLPSTSNDHVDANQLGTGADSHRAYYYFEEHCLSNIPPKTTANGGTQAYYLDDSPATVMFDGGIDECIYATSGYKSIQIYDLSGKGQHRLRRVLGMRAGDTHSLSGAKVDVLPQLQVGNVMVNGGTVEAEDCTFMDTAGNGIGNVKFTNCRYVNPRKAWVSGNGLTKATAKRPENVIQGTITRSGADFATYTVPGDVLNATFAEAFWALADFFEPKAGWGTPGVPHDPATWPGAPVHP